MNRALALAEGIAANGAFPLSHMTVHDVGFGFPSTYRLTFGKAGDITGSGTLARIW